MFNRIMSYAGEEKKKTVLAMFCISIAVLLSVIPFLLACQMITPLVTGEGISAGKITGCVIGVFMCLALHGILYCAGLVFSHQAAFGILERIRMTLQRRMEKLPLGIIQEKGIGTIKRLCVDDVESMEILLVHAIPEGFGNALVPIVVYVILFVVDWKLALLSMVSIFIGVFAMMKMFTIGTKEMDNYYKAGQVMNNTIIEYINGMEVVKVFNKDGESFQRFKTDVANYRDFTLAWYRACWSWMAIYNALVPCTTLFALPFGSWFVMQGYSTLPDLILVLCLSFSVGVPILKMLGFLPQFPQLNYKLEKLEQVLDAEPLRQTKDTFYGNEITALVGESGSGKSTLAKLLVHYYDTQKGMITIGGQDITKMSLEALNQRISYVSQEQFLFNTSLLENIRMGKLDATDEEVLEAARKAQCMEFIEKLPNGIHTMAGDGGKQLSGGQRQRIALARAIIKDAPIVVLDEATAFTDPENEEKMDAAIKEVVKGKTLLVIAHKLPSVMNANQICVMQEGKVEAIGTHDVLLNQSAEYRKLWQVAMDSAEWKVGKGA